MGQVVQNCTDCGTCEDDCCCVDIKFDYCVVRGSCGAGDYGEVEDCKALNIQLQWKVPDCITDLVGAATLRYRIYDQDTDPETVTFESAYLKEVEGPEDNACGGDGEMLTREEWAEDPFFCSNCTPTNLLLIAWIDEDKVAHCKACQDELCDEPCSGCDLDIECWTLSKYGEKCGWGFADTVPPKRYAHAVSTLLGGRVIEHDPPPMGETSDCLDSASTIGTDADNPITFTYDVVTRISITGETSLCSSTCGLTHEDGADSDEGTSYEGQLEDCLTPSPITDPIGELMTPAAGSFYDPIEDVFFTVVCFDEEVEFAYLWTLDTNNPPTYRAWSWVTEERHTNDDGFSLPRHQCYSVPSDDDIDWTTNCNNYYDVTFSDEITTTELTNLVSTGLANPDDYDPENPNWSHSDDASCYACWRLASNQLTAYYRSIFVRITNISGASAVVSWDIATWPEAGNDEFPCTKAETSPSLDHDSTTLADGAHVDIEVYPTTTSNKIMQVINIGCELVVV